MLEDILLLNIKGMIINMRMKMKKILRYPLADLYMIFAYSIAFFVLFIALFLADEIFQLNKDSDRYAYDSTYTVEYHGDFEELLEVTKDLSCNVTIENYPVSIKLKGELQESAVDIILRENEALNLQFLSGKLGKQRKTVNIGKLSAEYLGLKKGDKLEIGGEMYKISGIIGVKSSNYFDYVTCICYEAAGEKLEQSLEKSHDFSLRLESNSHDTSMDYAEILKMISDESSAQGITKSNTAIIGGEQMQSCFYFLAYVFALIHCVIASDIWISQRKKEIAVKKMLGFRFGEIFKNLYIQNLRLITVSAGLCFIIYFVASVFGKQILETEVRLNIRSMLVLVVFIFFTTFITIIRSIRVISKKTSRDVLSEREN